MIYKNRLLNDEDSKRVEAFGSIAEGLEARKIAMKKLDEDRAAGRPIYGFLNERNEICPMPGSKPTFIYPADL